ncbi:DNA cytosine methyltransferase, partial [Streptomyces boncukensis]
MENHSSSETFAVLDLFAGPGGWSEGLTRLGLRDVGIEIDAAACATRAAAGHATIRADVTTCPTAPFAGRTVGQVHSPVCTPYSGAGKGLGLDDLEHVHQAVHDLAQGRDTRTHHAASCADPASILAAEPMRWLYDLRPRWVAMEQVPQVLPLWRQYAQVLRGWGYSTWTGVLNAADYGTPQTRKRAILIASRTRPVTAPAPTHTEHPRGADLFGESLPGWVSMAGALGWDTGVQVVTRGDRKTSGGNVFCADRPSWALTEKTRSWVLRHNSQKNATIRPLSAPAGTLFFGHHLNEVVWTDGQDKRSITESEAAVLQTFPADYPWQGARTKRFEQIGNAVPPLLAAHIIATTAGLPT